MKRVFGRVAFVASIWAISCVEPYPIKSTDYKKQLVIEGFISSDSKQHEVTLSATSPINKEEVIPETGAQLSIHHGSEVIPLTENAPGVYRTAVLQGTVGDAYQLTIKTADGREYASDEVTLRKAPDIKQIYARYLTNQPDSEDGIHFYVDAEDPTGKTRYYRWEFEGTYEIKTPYPSAFDWLGGNDVVFRDQPVDRCWAADTSRNIIIATTNGLSEDRVTAIPVHFIPAYAYSMRIKYSLLVRQYALSDKGYLFWKTLRDINQTQGSLFDVQPGVVRGNVQSKTDPNEVVLGYFDACTVTEKRVFFTPADFTDSGYKSPKFLTSCDNFIPEEVADSKIGDFMSKNGNATRFLISESVGAGPATFLMRPKYCCDCRNLGTNIRPSYWQ